MEDDKWRDIVGRIQDSFEVLEHQTEPLDPGPGEVEFIEFIGPLGKMKVERVVKPVILGKKGIGSKRIGSTAHVDYEYSETEQTKTFRAYVWNDERDGWVEMEKTHSTFSL